MSADLISDKQDPGRTGSFSSGGTSHTASATEHSNVFTPAAKSSPAARDYALLEEHLYPDDSYTAGGVYWADLKGREKRHFINSTSNLEAKRELKVSFAAGQEQ